MVGLCQERNGKEAAASVVSLEWLGGHCDISRKLVDPHASATCLELQFPRPSGCYFLKLAESGTVVIGGFLELSSPQSIVDITLQVPGVFEDRKRVSGTGITYEFSVSGAGNRTSPLYALFTAEPPLQPPVYSLQRHSLPFLRAMVTSEFQLLLAMSGSMTLLKLPLHSKEMAPSFFTEQKASQGLGYHGFKTQVTPQGSGKFYFKACSQSEYESPNLGLAH
ncbi:hypothetical protein STEG23_013897, partial [Scotinomys teguina]